MIRFVDMRKADVEGVRFAFWDTVTDRFVELAGEQAWAEVSEIPEDPSRWRLIRVVPRWAFNRAPHG